MLLGSRISAARVENKSEPESGYMRTARAAAAAKSLSERAPSGNEAVTYYKITGENNVSTDYIRLLPQRHSHRQLTSDGPNIQ